MGSSTMREKGYGKTGGNTRPMRAQSRSRAIHAHTRATYPAWLARMPSDSQSQLTTRLSQRAYMHPIHLRSRSSSLACSCSSSLLGPRIHGCSADTPPATSRRTTMCPTAGQRWSAIRIIPDIDHIAGYSRTCMHQLHDASLLQPAEKEDLPRDEAPGTSGKGEKCPRVGQEGDGEKARSGGRPGGRLPS